MTWVVTTSGIGQTISVSDIRVSWKAADIYVDCLQKIHPVGRYMAAGFSGSVRLGMEIVSDLQKYLYIPPNQEGCWIPGVVLHKWRRRARRIFSQATREYQELGCSLIISGVFWIEEWGPSPFPKTAVAVLKSPEFVPEWAKYKECVSIGSGNRIEEYRAHVAGISSNLMTLWQMEVGAPGGAAGVMGFTSGRLVQTSPAPGISRHMHICRVSWGSVGVSTNDWTQVDQNGERTDHVMPKVARTWEEFKSICMENGLSEAQASC